MRSLLVVLAWCRLAAADSPRAIELERQRVEVGRSHLALRLLRGTTITRDTAVFDWGTARLILKVYESELRPTLRLGRAIVADLARERLAADVVPLRLADSLDGYAIVPRRQPGPDQLIYGAYIAGPDGNVDVLAFYVDFGGIADLEAWTDVARDIVANALWHELERIDLDSFSILLPHRATHGARSFSIPEQGGCTFRPSDASDLPPLGAQRVPGRLLGQTVEWYVGTDFVTASTDSLDVHCSADDPRGLGYLMYLAQTLAGRP